MRRFRDPDGLSRMEILGAWLGFWTPRDVEVPPVPKRKLALAAAGLAIVLAVAAAVAIPAIQSGKDEGAERERRAEDAARAADRRERRAEQRAHHGRGRPARDAAGRAELFGRMRESIAADARRRVRAGELKGPIRRVDCEPSPNARDGKGSRVSLGCTAVTREIPAGPRSVPGALGHPFVAVADLATGRYTWCKTNPVPGEQVVPDPRDVVELPRECVL